MSIPHKSFYFVRHGETEWNQKGITMGQTDIELNATGLKQAKEIAEVLKDENFKSIATSPLKRAFQTAQIISQASNTPITIIDDFKEISLGEAQGQSRQLQRITEWRKGGKIEGAESFSAFVLRVKRGLEQALKLPEPVLIVAHGGVYWAIQSLLGTSFSDLSNCATIYHRPPEHPTHHWLISSLDESL